MSNNNQDQARRELVEGLDRLNTNCDKFLASLSGGAIAISIVFLQNTTGNDGTLHVEWLLLFAWISFTVSLLTILLGILSGIHLHRAKLDGINIEKPEKIQYEISNVCAHYSQWASSVFLIIGIILTIIFVYYNLEK